MNTIIYIIDDEVLKINSDRTFWAALRDVLNQFNRAARFNVTRVTSYSDRSETHVCKQRTNDQCRTHRQDLLISASHQEHMKFIDVNKSEKINKVTNQRNEINTLSIDYEMTIVNLIDCVC